MVCKLSSSGGGEGISGLVWLSSNSVKLIMILPSWSAVRYRELGSLERTLRIISSNSWDISGFIALGEGGDSYLWFKAISCGEGLLNGSSPVNISNNTTPRLYTSEAGEGALPAACSGKNKEGNPKSPQIVHHVEQMLMPWQSQNQ